MVLLPRTIAWIARLLLALVAVGAYGEGGWNGSERLDAVIQQAIDDGTIPGAVALVGIGDQVVHRKAYGSRSLVPEREPMTVDTIFDCASLTKVVVTAPAVMMLIEEGRLRLDDPVTRHLPQFAGGRSEITVRELLTHYSGLRPDLDVEPPWSGYLTGVAKAYQEGPVARPGTRFIYSDINYILLAELIHKLSAKPLEELARERIFTPLVMNESRFNPADELHPRIAPTEQLADGTILRGVVHDPTTRFMGGVAGHAGLFATADDLSRFARMMLRGGELDGKRILSPLAVAKMTTPQSPADQPVRRGLGWDFDSPYSSPRGDLFPPGSYGHSGFTGTSLWIDPFTRSYVILLSNRVHPYARTSVVSLRSRIASVVAAALTEADTDRLRLVGLGLGGYWAPAPQPSSRSEKFNPVLTGIDVLARDGWNAFQGKRVGLITNHTGIDRRRRRNVDLFAGAPGVKLQAIFSPEHGIGGKLDQNDVGDTVDSATGVRVHSLYKSDRRRPTAKMLEDIDVLVFDIQDIGARFYTYATTMAYAMEEAAKRGIPFYVLDRPNPIRGDIVEGPMLDAAHRSFVGYFPMPVRHGMTIGELAAMFNTENHIGAELEVVKMEGWRRDQWFDETALPWVDPSPNIRTPEQALLYPGIALLEGLQNYSVGRGTDTPFQFIGADWIDGAILAEHLNGGNLPGVTFYAVRRTPASATFANREIDGVQIEVVDRDSVRATRVGIQIATALLQLFPGRVTLEQTAKLLGHQLTIQSVLGGKPGVHLEAMGIRARGL